MGRLRQFVGGLIGGAPSARRLGLPPAPGLCLRGDLDVRTAPTARVQLGHGVTLSGCRIDVADGAELVLGDGVAIEGGSLVVGPGASFRAERGVTLVQTPPFALTISVLDGRVTIGEEATLRGCMRVRFGGSVHIGSRAFVNQGTDIRCDIEVRIGDCTMVSYDVHIGDTNSHSVDWRVRREAIAAGSAHTLTDEPRPVCRPVHIGDDCWIGKRAMILKGARVGDRAIVGAAAVVTADVPPESVAVGNPATSHPIDLSEADA